jgi:hypothetical protein
VAFDLVFASSPSTRDLPRQQQWRRLHTSVHQAIVNGIYETVERDALMVTWLNELSLPRLVLGAGRLTHGPSVARSNDWTYLVHVDIARPRHSVLLAVCRTAATRTSSDRHGGIRRRRCAALQALP